MSLNINSMQAAVSPRLSLCKSVGLVRLRLRSASHAICYLLCNQRTPRSWQEKKLAVCKFQVGALLSRVTAWRGMAVVEMGGSNNVALAHLPMSYFSTFIEN